MREIYLPCGAVTLVSDVDYERCSAHKWRANWHTASGEPYVMASIAGKTIYLHRFITGCPSTHKTDHRDRDTLNNQRPNLRIATFEDNNANRCGFGLSGFKGVSMDRRRWRARIKIDGIDLSLGTFGSKTEAAKAYDAAAFERYGEFAFLNFPDDYPRPCHDLEPLPEIPF